MMSACNTIPVDVSKRHPSPHPLWSRPVATVKTYETRPPGGVAVYGLQAQGGDVNEVETAIREKAADLGCDGIMLLVRADQSVSQGVALTGKVGEARQYTEAHIDALCVVDPAIVPDFCKAPPPESGAPATATAAATAAVASLGAVDSVVRSALERWRQAYEARSSDALAKLYAHDENLSVVEDGARLLGWTAVAPALRDRLGRAAVIHVRLADIEVHSLGPTAIVVATMQREQSDGAASVTERGLLTLVLRASETAGDPSWVIVAEHYSKRV